MSDQELQQLESQFPASSAAAFAEACERVLASGQSVLQSKDGAIYERFPDGRVVFVKRVEPPTPVTQGSVILLR